MNEVLRAIVQAELTRFPPFELKESTWIGRRRHPAAIPSRINGFPISAVSDPGPGI